MAIVPFTDTTLRGVVGGHANSEEWNAVTRVSNGDVIGMGQPVARDASNDELCDAWASGAYLGVTRYTVSADDTTGFADGANVPIMTMGVMWVAAGAAVDAGEPAGYNPATDRWGEVAGSYAAVVGCEFDSSTGGAGLVKLRINRPAAVTAEV